MNDPKRNPDGILGAGMEPGARRTSSWHTLLPIQLEWDLIGRVKAGSLLRQMDIHAALQAMRYCQNQCLTLFFSHVNFNVPVYHPAEVYIGTRVIYVPPKSSTVDIEVEVYARHPGESERHFCARGYVTMIRVDSETLRPVKDMPQFKPANDEDQKRYDAAVRRRDFLRRELPRRIEEKIEILRSQNADPTDDGKEDRRAPEPTLALSQINPIHLNPLGTLHGGNALYLIDEAANSCAREFTGAAETVTAAIEGIRFRAPIPAGSIALIRCRVVYTHETSMIVAVEVCRTNNIESEVTLAHAGHWVIVRISREKDETGRTVQRPAPVPGLLILPPVDGKQSSEEKERYEFYLRGRARRELWKETDFLSGTLAQD